MDKEDIFKSARNIVDQKPDPIINFLLRTRILGDSVPQSMLRASGWYSRLKKEQEPSGSFGRFHSKDYRLKKEIATTETAVSLFVTMGLDNSDPVVRKTIRFMERVHKKEDVWPDPAEKHPWWEPLMLLLNDSVLSRLKPYSPLLDDTFNNWISVAESSFKSGQYELIADKIAQQEIFGTKKTFHLFNKYAFFTLTARIDDVPKKLQDQLLSWIWHRPEGFYYYSRKKESLSSFKDADDKVITGVLLPAVNILRRFPCWKTACGDFIQYLINRRGEDGYWDFGKPANITNEVLFPLSENRRKSINRKLDYTTHVLLLLNSYFDE
jgi:hypothetical protein